MFVLQLQILFINSSFSQIMSKEKNKLDGRVDKDLKK